MAQKSIAMALVAASLSGSAQADDVTPIQKVLTMMEEMLAKGKAMKHEEEVEFSKFHEWCDNVRKETERDISNGADQIEQLAADISKASSDAEVLSAEVEDLDKATGQLEADAKSASAERKKEKEVFEEQHIDLSESVDAIARAISVLKSRGADVPQSLLQVTQSSLVPEEAKKALTSFLSVHEGSESGAPEANAYEFQSGSIVSLLENLKRKFEDQRLVLEKEEMNAKAAYEVLMQQLTDDIKANNGSASAKTAAKAGRLEAAAQAKGDKAVTEKTKATDEKTLLDTNTQCRAKSEEFEANQVTRKDEIAAIEKAIEIISSDAVKGAGEKHLPSALLQKKHAFAQLRSSFREAPEARQRAINYLQSQASKLGSRYLSVVAAHTEADPFEKVKSMIKDLITKLMEEANAEQDQHGYCQAELATNKQTRDIKSSEVEELTAKIESETSTSQRLSSEITALADALSELKAKQSEATEMRNSEKKTNAKAVSEAAEAQRAVEQAIKVLNQFYESQESGAFVQKAKNQKAKEPYKGMGATSGGIVGMLEVVLSDFARLETETSESEASSQRSYEKFMDESEQDAAVKETEKAHKEKNRDRADEKLRGFKKELEMTQSELDTALDYYDKLKTQCVDTGLSYEERKKMREEEIASLQEALKILSGEDI